MVTRQSKKKYVSCRKGQEREHKERKDKETNFIIMGIRDYGKHESTLNLKREFLKEKLEWRRQIS